MKNQKITFVILFLTIFLSSCLSNEEKKVKAEEEGNAIVSIKSKLIKGASDALKTDGKDALESASEAVGEVFKGINSGYDKSINQAKVISDSTFLKTFKIGRTEKIYNDSTNIKKVTIYLIANKSFENKIKLKAYNQTEKEIGRSSKNVKLEEDGANLLTLNLIIEHHYYRLNILL